MNTRMLGTILQPHCGKCCGAHRKSTNVRQKRQARAIERRVVARIIREET